MHYCIVKNKRFNFHLYLVAARKSTQKKYSVDKIICEVFNVLIDSPREPGGPLHKEMTFYMVESGFYNCGDLIW